VRLRIVSQLWAIDIITSDRVGTKILWKAHIYSIKRDDQVFCIIDLFECFIHAWLATDGPCEVLVCHSVLQAHSLLGDVRELVLVDGRWVLAIET
jgi:hypothetical protein